VTEDAPRPMPLVINPTMAKILKEELGVTEGFVVNEKLPETAPTVPPGQLGCFICGGEHGNLPCPHTTVTCSTNSGGS